MAVEEESEVGGIFSLAQGEMVDGSSLLPLEELNEEMTIEQLVINLSRIACVYYRNTLKSQFTLTLLIPVEVGSSCCQIPLFINVADMSRSIEEVLVDALKKIKSGIFPVKNIAELTPTELMFYVSHVPIEYKNLIIFEKILGSNKNQLVVVEVTQSFSRIYFFVSGLYHSYAHFQKMDNHYQTLKRDNPDLTFIDLLAVNMLSKDEALSVIKIGAGKYRELTNAPVFLQVELMLDDVGYLPAVYHKNQALTYAEMFDASLCVAKNLLISGVVKGDKIAVFCRPNVYMPSLVLGVHRAGAVYVPVDPTFPRGRIEAILDEIGPAKIISNIADESLSFLHDYSPTLSIASLLEDVSDAIAVLAFPDVTLEDASHIFFTSGTTGKPKGVLSSHKNLIHYLSTGKNVYGFHQGDKFISAARFTFSISFFEFLLPISVGGSVRFLDREDVLDFDKLLEALAEINCLHFGPSLLGSLIAYVEMQGIEPHQFDHIRHVSTGGDMVPALTLEKLKKYFRQAEIFVIYGSSEINCMGATYRVPLDETVTVTKVGTPHENVTLRLLDDFDNLVPQGVCGTVCFSGPGLASGYLNLPDKTADKFILIDGDRYYRMGDIGRIDNNGNLELLGREDYQVQIRGIRIELAEVEFFLRDYPAIEDCVAVACTLQAEEKSLVAYIVIKSGNSLCSEELNQYLADLLPDYAIPSCFVCIDKLPLNHNLKLDRSSLPIPCRENILRRDAGLKKGDEVDCQLADIWRELLPVEDFSGHDNFFELGGDSLLAVRMAVMIEKTFGKKIQLIQIFAHPTLAGMSKIIHGDDNAENIDVITLNQGDERPPLFCLYGAMFYQDLAKKIDPTRTVYGVFLSEEIALLEKGLQSPEFEVFSDIHKTVNAYMTILRKIQPQGPYFLTGHSYGGLIALEVARQLQEEGECVELLVMLDTWLPGFRDTMSPLAKLGEHVRLFLRDGISHFTSRLNQRSAKRIRENCSGYSVTRPPIDVRIQARALACQNYKAKVYDYPVVLIKARQVADFQPRSNWLGWKPFFPKAQLYQVEGAHMTMVDHDRVENVAEIFRTHMATKQ